MKYYKLSIMPIGSKFEINQGVNATKSSNNTITVDCGSVYKFEPIGENIKFIKLT